MSTIPLFQGDPGPFRADQLHPGDRYELSDGHALYCAPTGEQGGEAAARTAMILDSDPDCTGGGVDVGYSPTPGTLRAPDVSISSGKGKPGWVPGVPPLAIEYADRGQDEESLQLKIRELLGHGTKQIWVVRLMGPRRVEIYEPGQPLRIATAGELLPVPGELRNPIPVEALYDKEAAREAVFRNLLQRHGYESLEQIEAEGQAEGQAEGRRAALRAVLAARGWSPTVEQIARIDAESDAANLERWLVAAVRAGTIDEALG